MQASTSGFFVHVTHDNSSGTDLRLAEAQTFLRDLSAATADVERHHAETETPHGESLPPEAPPVEETKAEAKKANSRSKK